MHGNTDGEKHISRCQPCLHPKGAETKRHQFLGPYLASNGLTRATVFDTVTYVAMDMLQNADTKLFPLMFRSGPRSTSTSTRGYLKPRLRKKFAERVFPFSGPAEWNCLPNDHRMITDVFKRKLKAYFYKQAFCVA